MEKYLNYLLDDITNSTLQAPALSNYAWKLGFPGDDQEEEMNNSPALVKLCNLFNLAPDAFPPHHLLDDEQLLRLVEAIERLWNAWHFSWKFPMNLPQRKRYTVMVQKMRDELVSWSTDTGGTIPICCFEEGGPCPFDPDRQECYCQYIDDIASREVQAWEEHVRSQGLNPYLTPEEEKEIDDYERRFRLQKRYGDDWKRYYSHESQWEDDSNASRPAEPGYEDDFDDEMPYWLMEEEPFEDWFSQDDLLLPDEDFLTDNDDSEEEDFNLPF